MTKSDQNYPFVLIMLACVYSLHHAGTPRLVCMQFTQYKHTLSSVYHTLSMYYICNVQFTPININVTKYIGD